MALQCASRLQTIENSMAETLKCFESTFTSLQRSVASKSDRFRTVEASLATSSSPVEDRRRSSVGLVKREAKSWALAKGSYSVVRLLGGRGAQDGFVRVVALWEGCSHSRDDRDHHGWHPCSRRGVHRGCLSCVSRRASAARLCSGCGAIGRWARGYCSCEAAASVVV